MGRSKTNSKTYEATQALKQLSQEKPKAPRNKSESPYSAFSQLNGDHPWMDIVPEGHISYQVRNLNKGKVAYLNYDLAKEMGLIDKNHSHKMNKRLEKELLNTFSIRIINEYDQEHKIRFPKKHIKENEFMATRYLQLQHSNKTGTTSGDGRCIWNGSYIHKGITWDVSSRGTGVTSLAPGAVQAGKNLKSGNTDFGYGCGLAEIDELYSAALMAEILHKNGINTERVLTIIDIGGGFGIGVRAGKNLFRPAHLFMHLKQENYDALKRATDYFILRQIQNKEWDFSIKSPKRFDYLLKHICEDFAKFTAILEREYIFAWLDWDGDNVLATAGIIDYGSVRQFGLRHDQYRYDDVERFSTTLTEQKQKARLIVQVFIQMVDYLNTGKRKKIESFKNHKVLKEFDKLFNESILKHFLYQQGFNKKQQAYLLKNHLKAVDTYYHDFYCLEKVKTCKKKGKIADGVNRPAILNMRSFSRVVISHFSNHPEKLEAELVEPSQLFSAIISQENSIKKDLKMTPSIEKNLVKAQEDLCKLLQFSCNESSSVNKELSKINNRCEKVNREDRVTGNALLYIVNEIMSFRKKGLSHGDIQQVMDEFIESQIIKPEKEKNSPKLNKSQSKKLMTNFLTIIEGHKEDI